MFCFLVVQRSVLRLFTEKIIATGHQTEIDTIRTELCTENKALVAHVVQVTSRGAIRWRIDGFVAPTPDTPTPTQTIDR